MTAPADEPRAEHGFPKNARLLRRSEFLAVQSKGQRVHTTHFTLALRDRGDGDLARLGVTASRKAANSVGRNRIRRLVREVFRHHRAAFPAGCDCVVIVHEKVPELGLAAVEQELLSALSRRRPGGSGRGHGRPVAPLPTGQTAPTDTKKTSPGPGGAPRGRGGGGTRPP